VIAGKRQSFKALILHVKQNRTRTLNILYNSVTIGLIGTAFYFFGYVQDSTLLTSLNLPTSEFIRRPEELIHDGFLIFIGGRTILVNLYIILALGAVYAFTFFLSFKFKLFKSAKYQFIEFTRKYSGLVFSLYLILLFLTGVADAMHSGARAANSLQKSSHSLNHEIYFTENERQPLKCLLIRSSSTAYGVLDVNNKAVIIVQKEIVAMVKSKITAQ